MPLHNNRLQDIVTEFSLNIKVLTSKSCKKLTNLKAYTYLRENKFIHVTGKLRGIFIFHPERSGETSVRDLIPK